MYTVEMCCVDPTKPKCGCFMQDGDIACIEHMEEQDRQEREQEEND